MHGCVCFVSMIFILRYVIIKCLKTFKFPTTLNKFKIWLNMIHKTLFSAKITDGYTFRNAICMIKNESDEITLLVSAKNISIRFFNKGQYAIHDININADDLCDYKYNIVDHDEYPITINTTELFNTTKGLGRKDSISICWLEGYEKISVQPEKSGKELNRSTASFIDIIHKKHNHIELHNDFTGNEPSIKIQSKEFSDFCAQVMILKCSHMEISGCSSHVTFKGIKPDSTIGNVSRHTNAGYRNDVDDNLIEKITGQNNNIGQLELNVMKTEELIKIRVPLITVKTLSKIHNISPAGSLIKICLSPQKPVKLESRIGGYGSMVIYMRDVKK
jgi:hypothetical protein